MSAPTFISKASAFINSAGVELPVGHGQVYLGATDVWRIPG